VYVYGYNIHIAARLGWLQVNRPYDILITSTASGTWAVGTIFNDNPY